MYNFISINKLSKKQANLFLILSPHPSSCHPKSFVAAFWNSPPPFLYPLSPQTGSHAKNVKIRVRENNSYELVSTNGTTTPDQLDNQSESEHLMEEKMDEGSGGRGEGVTLEMFQKRQKMMEEQNRLRREMLAKAIADRYVCAFSLFLF